MRALDEQADVKMTAVAATRRTSSFFIRFAVCFARRGHPARFTRVMFFHRLNDRHSLRELALSDTEELFAVCDANRAHLRRWLPWLDRTRAPADTHGFIESTLRQTENNQGFQAVILAAGRIAG